MATEDSRPEWLRRLQRHPVVATMAAVIAVVVALSAVLDLPGKVTAAWATITGGDRPRPELVIDKAELVPAANIDAVETGPDSSTSKVRSTGSAVDITLRNTGSSPALIVGATASFRSAVQLRNCSGAGPGVASADYDLSVPTDVKTTSRPFTLHRDMRFIVAPNSIDRFTMTIGPDSFGDAAWPWIYQADLSLVEDSGKRLPVGSVALAGYVGESWNRLQDVPTPIDPYDLPCFVHDAGVLSAAMSSPGLHSPELKTLDAEAKKLIATVGSCGGSATSQGSCPGEAGDYFSDARGVHRCSDSLEVVQSYDCSAAVNVRNAYGQSGLKDVSLTVTSGGLTLPMACSPAGTAEVCRSTDAQDLVVGFVP